MILDYLKKHSIPTPELHIVLGSGLSSAFEHLNVAQNWEALASAKFSEVGGISDTTVAGHTGQFKYFRHKSSGKCVCFQVGRLHGYEGLDPKDVVAPLTQSYLAGTRKFLLSNASGGLTTDFKPGSVMVIKDHFNFTGKTPLLGKNQKHPDTGADLGPRFPDMTQAWDPELTQKLKSILQQGGHDVHEGNYCGVLGPSYETPIEIKIFGKLGLHAVGMSTVWEAIQLRYLKAKFCGVSFISNYGAGLVAGELNHEDVEKEGKKIAVKLVLSLFIFAEKEFV